MITFTEEEKQRIYEIEKFLRFAHPGKKPVEVRALGGEANGTIRHLSPSHRSLAISAIMADQTGAQVYWCLNPIKADNQYAERNVTDKPMRHVRYTAGDKDIFRRSNYLIDVDSVTRKG
jgi:hypothetical protein